MSEVNIFLKHKSLGCDMMRDTVRNIESCSDWYGSWLMEIYVIYDNDNATECPKQKLLLGLYGELFCVDREEKSN